MEHRRFSGAFFEIPTMQRRETTAGKLILDKSRNLFDFVAEVESSHDLFPKHWCRHAALILMKRALMTAEPIYRLAKSYPHTGV